MYDYNQRHYSSVYSMIDTISKQTRSKANFVVLTPVVPQFNKKVPNTVFRFFENESDLKTLFVKSIK